MQDTTLPENVQSMIDDFSFLTDWEDRYTHVIDMGRQLPPLSEAHIVKGLVAVALEIFSGRRPREILALDAEDILDKLDLSEHLSPQRSNGLRAMIGRIKSEAERVTA